jgi:uncharacterized protein YnzC (UPF0291/DUF896 family)
MPIIEKREKQKERKSSIKLLRNAVRPKVENMHLICIVREEGYDEKGKETIVTVIRSFRKYAGWYKN